MSKFKIGDKVRPTHWVDKSYNNNMFHDETGVVVVVREPHLYTVKRDKDGELFTAHEMYWEEAMETMYDRINLSITTVERANGSISVTYNIG